MSLGPAEILKASARIVVEATVKPEIASDGILVTVSEPTWAAARYVALSLPGLIDAVDVARESRDAAESAAKAAVQAEMAALRKEIARLKNQLAYREAGMDIMEGR